MLGSEQSRSDNAEPESRSCAGLWLYALIAATVASAINLLVR